MINQTARARVDRAVASLREQRIFRRLQAVLAVVRPAGWFALAAALIGFLAGRWLGWQELLVISGILAVLLVGAIGFVLGRSAYAVKLDLTRLRVRVGAEVFGGLTVTNTSTRALIPSLFRLPVGRVTSRFAVPRLAGGAEFEETFQVDTSKRAVVSLGPVSASRGDGLGFLRRDLQLTETQELFVHPVTVSLHDSSTGFLKDLEGRPTDTLSSSDIAFHALRDYLVGDDLRHVHWKSSARTGRLLVRQFEETRRSHLVVCLSMSGDDFLSETDFELAVSSAASLGEQAILKEKDLTIQVPGRRLDIGTRSRMLDDFARLEFGPPVPSFDSVTLAASSFAPDASVVVLAVGAPVDASRLHRATTRFNVDAFTVVLRCETGARLSRSAIGSSPVLTIGGLDDLPRALRSLEV